MLKMIYISQGNIPSKWAHTMQTMKMAEAFSQIVSDFRLLVQAHWTWFFRRRFDYEGWYGITNRFKIARIPVRGIPSSRIIEDHLFPDFDKKATQYAFRLQPDFIYTRSLYAARLCIEAGLKTLVEQHAPPHFSEFKWLFPVVKQKNLLGVVTITDALKKAYADSGIDESKIMVWPSAVDLGRYSDLKEKHAIREELGISQEDRIATYCGHFYEHKGVSYLIEAAKLLPEVKFYLIGGWPQDLINYGKICHDLDNVILTGFIPNSDVPKYLSASDILLLPNSIKYEQAYITSPLKLFEYMASKKPIIAAKIPAFENILIHGENAYLVEPDSTSSIVTAILNLINNSKFSDELSEGAWKTVQSYSWVNRAQSILKHFGFLLS